MPETSNPYGFYDTAGNPGYYFGQKTKWKDNDTLREGQANAAANIVVENGAKTKPNLAEDDL